MRSLLLTLGHNSSAIVVEDGKIVQGYETERLTGVKSDSRFPAEVINKFDMKFDDVYVSHWEPTANLGLMSSKHWQFHSSFKSAKIISVSPELTHHDCHANSAWWFAGKEFPLDGTMIFVVDGFGNFGEHISIYKFHDGRPKLFKRFFGYDTSLGLLYQYTTAFLGLKMHEDEYKLLGYEAHINTIPVDLNELDRQVEKWTQDWIRQLTKNTIDPDRNMYDPLINLNALMNVRINLHTKLNKFCGVMECDEPTSWRTRVLVSYLVQSVLDGVMHYLVSMYRPQNLLLAGGVFYNVKTNYLLMKQVPGKTCVMPLAGDQGAAIGLYVSFDDNPSLQEFDGLYWGPRNLMPCSVPGIIYVKNKLEAASIICSEIHKNGFVNVVTGAMEFGPRALCHTSTLALPTMEIVNHINHINGRNTVMPFAPVMRPDTFTDLFDLTEKSWKSHGYMITAFPYKSGKGNVYAGAAHMYPDGLMTGRPQVYAGKSAWLTSVLSEYPVLINTSFNVHGVPIVCSMPQIEESHWSQRNLDHNVVTVIIGD